MRTLNNNFTDNERMLSHSDLVKNRFNSKDRL